MIAATCTTDVNSKIHKQLQPTSCSLDSQNTSDSCQPQNTFAWQLVIQTFKEYTSKRVGLGHRIKIKWGTHRFYLKSVLLHTIATFYGTSLFSLIPSAYKWSSTQLVKCLHCTQRGQVSISGILKKAGKRDPCLKAEEAIDNQCWQ